MPGANHSRKGRGAAHRGGNHDGAGAISSGFGNSAAHRPAQELGGAEDGLEDRNPSRIHHGRRACDEAAPEGHIGAGRGAQAGLLAMAARAVAGGFSPVEPIHDTPSTDTRISGP